MGFQRQNTCTVQIHKCSTKTKHIRCERFCSGQWGALLCSSEKNWTEFQRRRLNHHCVGSLSIFRAMWRVCLLKKKNTCEQFYTGNTAKPYPKHIFSFSTHALHKHYIFKQTVTVCPLRRALQLIVCLARALIFYSYKTSYWYQQ